MYSIPLVYQRPIVGTRFIQSATLNLHSVRALNWIKHESMTHT